MTSADANWPFVPLSEVTERVAVGIASAATHAYRTSGVPLIRNQNIKPGRLDDHDLLHIDPAYERSYKKKRLRGGDLLTVRTGYPGTTCVVPTAFTGAQSFTTLISRPQQEKVDPQFLNHYINSDLGQSFFTRSQIGGAQKNVNAGVLRGMPIPLPPIEEQRAIAATLDSAEHLIENLERLIAKKHNIKQGTMHELLTGQTRLGGAEGEWKTLQVAAQSQLKARIGWQGLTTHEYRTSGRYRLVGGTDFRDGRIAWESAPFVDKWRFDQDTDIQLKVGDILVTKDGTVGKVAFVDSMPGPATLNSGVFVVRPTRDAYVPEFLYWIFRSRLFEEFVASLSAGSTINHLYQRDLVALKLRVPPSLDEQRAIAAVLSDIDREIFFLERRLESARSIKTGMTQALLSERTRLPMEAAS